MKRKVTITDKRGFIAALFDITRVELSKSGCSWFFYSGNDFVASLVAGLGLSHDFPMLLENGTVSEVQTMPEAKA